MGKRGQQGYDFGDEDWGSDTGGVLLDTLAPPKSALINKPIRRRKFLLGAGIAGGSLLVAGFAGYKVLGYLSPPPNLFKLTGPLTTAQDIVVYTNGKLAANWQNWSWAANDLNSTAEPFHNQPTIRMSLVNWEALSLHDTAGLLDLTDYGYLQFYVNGGSGSDQAVFAFCTDARNNYTPQTPIAPYVDGGRILSHTWKLTRIPLNVMKVANTSVSGVGLQDASGGAQPDISIADLRLIYAPDLTPPRIVTAMALDLGTITLVFDKRMGQNDVESTRFYSITGSEPAYVTPQEPRLAHYHPVGQSVSLVVPTTMRAHNTYTVTVGPVRDQHNVAVADHSQAKVIAHPLTLSVDAAQGQRAISPLIYGVALASSDWLADVRPRLNRWGGNPMTRYNWKLGNAFSAARDYGFLNGNYGATSPADKKPSGVADEMVIGNKAIGAETILTIPTIGWVARDDHSSSTKVPTTGGPPISPGADAIRGYDPSNNRRLTCVPSRARKNGVLTNPPDLTDPTVAQDEWVYHLTRRFGTAASGGVRFYAMDNEPDLWFYTHTDIRPAELSYDQMRDIFLDYATAVKSVDPTALVTGPVVSGWDGYLYSALDRGDDNFRTRADFHAHGDQYFLPWWLSQIRQHDERTGQRSLDVLDIHYYPQTQGVFAGDTDLQTNAQRLLAVRSLWDPNYTDNSWINDKIQLIPRMKKWIQENYPGTRLGITEWNFGADQTLNGALAIAEVLGVFGREGVDLACYWAYTQPKTFGYAAQKLFTNFDGQGGSFGFTSVHAESSNYDLISCYAALDSSGQLMILVLNKSQVADLTPSIRLAHTQFSLAHVYQINESAPQITRLADVHATGGSVMLTLPASSITLLRFVK
jgi:hypothetical protein